MTNDEQQLQSEYPEEEADMASDNLDQSVARAIEFDSTYPPASTQTTGTTYSAPGSGSNLQQLVTRTLQGVLGRSFKPGDHESFRAALNVSFEVEQVSGKSAYKHIPRAYPSVGATDIGAGISGAQYSMVTFAKALQEQTRPLLKNLRSLNTSVDEEDLEATKAIFTTAWDEFVAELSREGGPRTSRADDLATRILGDDAVSGHLVDLGDQLAAIKKTDSGIVIDRSRVVTIEEEGHLTNFIALADYYRAASQAWIVYRDNFLGKDLGSGLLMIERALSVVEDGANEVYLAMDSVNINQAERLIITIGFPPPDDKLTVEDLLSWICSFVSQEGPTLIRDGGLRGVQAIKRTTEKLEQLTGQFINLIRPAETPPPSGNSEGDAVRDSGNAPITLKLPEQFNHARVINPLSELQRYLGELLNQAKAIAPDPEPTLSEPINPKPESGTTLSPGPNPLKPEPKKSSKA